MSEAIRNMLNAQVRQQNGAPAAAPESTPANAPKTSADPSSAEATAGKPDTPEKDVAASAEAEESLVEDPEVDDTPEVDPDSPEGDGNDPDPEDTDEPEGESEEDRKKTRAEKRINKLIHQRKKAESELEKANARIQELEEQARQGGSAAPAPTTTFTSIEEVDKRRLEIRDQLRTVNRYIREGGFTDDKTGDSIQVEELEKMAMELEDERDLTLPEVADRLRERERIDRDKVAKLYPDLLDEDSDTYLEAEEVFEALPILRTHPEGRLWVGRMLKGKRMERVPQRKAATPSQRKTETPEPPKEPGTDGAAVRTSVQPTEERTRQQELMSRLKQRREQRLART